MLADEKGLCLLIRPNGSKLWRHKYRFAGKEELASYGMLSEAGLKEARERRGASRAMLRAGKDPMAQAERERHGATEAAGAKFKVFAPSSVKRGEHWAIENRPVGRV